MDSSMHWRELLHWPDHALGTCNTWHGALRQTRSGTGWQVGFWTDDSRGCIDPLALGAWLTTEADLASQALSPTGSSLGRMELSKPSRRPISTKAFECSHCDRVFSRKHDQERHTRIHTGKKPYQCHACHSCFARSDARRRHIDANLTCQSNPLNQLHRRRSKPKSALARPR